MSKDQQTPLTLGEFLIEKAIEQPNLLIALAIRSPNVKYIWNYLKNIFRQKHQNVEPNFPKNILLQNISCGAPYNTYHKKYVITDAQHQFKVFYGSANLANYETDWAPHPIAISNDPNDPLKQIFRDQGKYRTVGNFNKERAPREPTHDIIFSITGDIARDFMHDFTSQWVGEIEKIFFNSADPSHLVLNFFRNCEQRSVGSALKLKLRVQIIKCLCLKPN